MVIRPADRSFMVWPLPCWAPIPDELPPFPMASRLWLVVPSTERIDRQPRLPTPCMT
jgi:hypothetical protein